MNAWAFTPDLFEHLEKGFAEFLKNGGATEMKKEYYLPFAVCELLQKQLCTVKAYASVDAWYGVTYPSDKEKVYASLQRLKDSGVYPPALNA